MQTKTFGYANSIYWHILLSHATEVVCTCNDVLETKQKRIRYSVNMVHGLR